jgi:hypothetical protein
LGAVALDDGHDLNVVPMRPAVLFAFAGEGADVVAPWMTTAVAKRRAATARASPALAGREMLLEWPECAADPALRLHAREIGRRGVGLEKRVRIDGGPPLGFSGRRWRCESREDSVHKHDFRRIVPPTPPRPTCAGAAHGRLPPGHHPEH